MAEKDLFYVVGNWKSNKTVDEAVAWWQDFSYLWKKHRPQIGNLKIILCPSFIHLTTLKSLIELSDIPISLGIQDISPFETGSYTAEVSAKMVKDLAKYVLVGHSERRNYFHEQLGELHAETLQAVKYHLQPIYCVQDKNMSIPEEVQIVAYEPIWAIGTGKPETPEKANQVALSIKNRIKRNIKIIYGGSVNDKNVRLYREQTSIDGVLPGGASLDAKQFFNIITQV